MRKISQPACAIFAQHSLHPIINGFLPMITCRKANSSACRRTAARFSARQLPCCRSLHRILHTDAVRFPRSIRFCGIRICPQPAALLALAAAKVPSRRCLLPDRTGSGRQSGEAARLFETIFTLPLCHLPPGASQTTPNAAARRCSDAADEEGSALLLQEAERLDGSFEPPASNRPWHPGSLSGIPTRSAAALLSSPAS